MVTPTASLTWLARLIVILAGASSCLAYAPFGYHWLMLPVLAVFLWLLQQSQSPRQAAWIGYCFGLGWFGAGISWVHVSIATFGGMPLVASLSIMALLIGYLALFPAGAAWLSMRILAPSHRLWPLLLTGCWVLFEYLRSVVLTGFPWLSLGYSQTNGWLGAYASYIGETGITAVLIGTMATLMHCASKPQQRLRSPALIVLATIWLAPLGLPNQIEATGQRQAVALVQGNIKQEMRWAPEQELPTMKAYLGLTRDLLADKLVVWPEAAIPQIEPLAQAYLMNLDYLANEQQGAVITGILDLKRNGDAYNGIIVLGQQPSAGYDYHGHNRYQKHHLLPIGEFVPFESWLRQVAPFFDLPNSSFARGDWNQPNLEAKGYQLLAALCFEIAFPRQLRANFSADTDFILTLSNDAWFGHSHGPWQHLEIAQMRAKEFGRPVLRATNNGVTAIINPDGSIQAQLPQFEQAVLQADVPIVQGVTWYARFGDWPLLVLTLFVFGISFYQRRLSPSQA